MSVAEIKSAVAQLTERDRAELAAWLLDSLPFPDVRENEDNGLAEAARRCAELDSGQVAALGSEEFWSDVDRERAGWK